MARRPDPPSLFARAARGPRGAWRRPSDHGRPDRRRRSPTTASIAASLVLGRRLARRTERGEAVGMMLPNSVGAGARVSRLAGDRPRPGDAEPHRRHRRRAVGLPHRRAAPRRSPRAALSSWPSSTPWPTRWPQTVEIVWLEDLRATARPGRQALRARRAAYRRLAAPPLRRRRLRAGGDPVHLGLGRRAERGRAEPRQSARQPAPARGARRLQPGRPSAQSPCRCSTASG